MNSSNITNLCRICSIPGSHSIFATIPKYLHEHPREYPYWKDPISKLISDITGLPVTKDDGLPQKICVLCISYLKHAVIFRRQALENLASLNVAKQLSFCEIDDKEKIKADLYTSASSFNIIPTNVPPPPSAGPFVNFKEDNNIRNKINVKTVIKSETSSSSSDEIPSKSKNENSSLLSNYFNYSEKAFEEDDVTTLDVFKATNIEFSLPDNFKEKKCPSCKKRFMFDDSLKDHLNQCMQYKLVKFVREVYHLLFLKEHRSISTYEFIRRIVFSIRKSNEIIDSYDGDTVVGDDIQMPIVQKEDFDTISSSSVSVSPLTIVSKCEQCNVKFENVMDLESHNFILHQNEQSMNNSILAHPIIPSSTTSLDVIKNNLVENPEDKYKTVKCSKCDVKFYTISHLDEHVIRNHSCKKNQEATSGIWSMKKGYSNQENNYFYSMETLKNTLR